MAEKIRFMIDRDKNEITFYVDEVFLRDLAKKAVEKNLSSEKLSDNITKVCFLVAKEVCKKLHLDLHKLKPNIIIIKPGEKAEWDVA